MYGKPHKYTIKKVYFYLLPIGFLNCFTKDVLFINNIYIQISNLQVILKVSPTNINISYIYEFIV